MCFFSTGGLTEAKTHFLYLAVVIPRIALNDYGGAIGLAKVGNANSDVYNSMIVPLTSLANAVVTGWYCSSRRLDLHNDRLYLAIDTIRGYLCSFALCSMPLSASCLHASLRGNITSYREAGVLNALSG